MNDENNEIMKNKCVIPLFDEGSRFGNWLFLIAACHAHCLRNGYEMMLPNDKELLNKILPDKFDVPDSMKPEDKHVYKEPTYHYTPIPNDVVGFIYGYFQSSKHFKSHEKEIKNLFKILISEKKNYGVAGIHVRLGDYIDFSSRFKSPNKKFIEKAFTYISPHIKQLMVFSDEIDRAVKLVKSCKGSERFTITPSNVMGETDEIHDIYFMTSCEELIMSCSSFSWWGAYLGEHNKVIVDKKWYNDNKLIEKDIYEDTWIRI